MTDYRAFLEEKIIAAPSVGFDVPIEELHPWLAPHAKAIVQWGLRGGRRAFFTAYGLHKTSMQLECGRQVLRRFGGRGLIVIPLGVRQEFWADAEKLEIGELPFIRRTEEAPAEGLCLTNYESVREGKVDPSSFGFASLDEADVLRSYGSKTFQTFLPLFDDVPYRFVATATPDPNRHKELIHYAGFLGVMDTGAALTRFFQRNSEKAGDLTLYPHKTEEFWLWVHSWAIFLQRPSDLGFSDDGYELPELKVRWHEVPSNLGDAGEDRDGQMRLMRDAASGVVEASREKRETIELRIGKMLEIVRGSIGGAPHGNADVQPALLRGEQGSREGARPDVLPREQAQDRSGEEESLHGSVQQDAPAKAVARGKRRAQPAAAGEICDRPGLSGEAEGARPRPERQGGDEEAGERAKGQLRADAGAVRSNARGPGRRLRNLRHDENQPGEGKAPAPAGRGSRSRDESGPRAALPSLQSRDCAVQGPAGPAGEGDCLPAGSQWVIWCDLNDEQRSIDRALASAGISYTSLYGNQPIDERDDQFDQWRARKTTAFVSKPLMYGAGVNMQQAHRMIFAGIGFKFRDFIQAIHRCHRFGQKHQVEVDLIYAETEREIRRGLEEKWARDIEQRAVMSRVIREFGLDQIGAHASLTRTIAVERQEASGGGWCAVNNDCIDETRDLPTDSLDLVITSIPFGNHYEYCASYRDFGHTDDDAHFFRQMDFLTPELLRALKPGRIAAIHVKDRILFGAVTGLGRPTVNPFHAKCIAHYQAHGFGYLGCHIVLTDVVRENNQTYRLGYSEMLRDATKMGAGSPEWVLLFCKPQTDLTRGYADVPVTKSGNEYSLARWQIDADAFWRSSGDRLLSADELAALKPDVLPKAFSSQGARQEYDYERHVAVGEALLERGALPKTYTALNPGSWSDAIWHDVTRMLTLNGEQSAKGREKHVCPLQFDIVDRLIRLYSNPGELVFDPFAGLMTVPLRALRLKRRGLGVELHPGYWRDGARYLEAAERELAIPSLMDLLDATPPMQPAEAAE